MTNEDTYKEDIKSFKKIFSAEAMELLLKDKIAVIYIGRETCPYCRKFAKKLSSIKSKINTSIYYINSADSSDEEITSFRDKYNIVTVPGFIVQKHGNIEIRCDSSMSENEIIDMIN